MTIDKAFELLLSWPVLLFGLALVFRPNVASALDRLRIVRTAHFEGRFDRDSPHRS